MAHLRDAPAGDAGGDASIVAGRAPSGRRARALAASARFRTESPGRDSRASRIEIEKLKTFLPPRDPPCFEMGVFDFDPAAQPGLSPFGSKKLFTKKVQPCPVLTNAHAG